MTTMLIALAAAAVFAGAAWYGWNRWFRDSEVNLLADGLTYVGMVAEFVSMLDDPGITELLNHAGIKPIWLVGIGIVIRLARRSRDRTMAVSQPYQEP